MPLDIKNKKGFLHDPSDSSARPRTCFLYALSSGARLSLKVGASRSLSTVNWRLAGG
jgi:hypothetical protein